MMTRSLGFQVCVSSSSGGGPSYVACCCESVPLGGGGAQFLRHPSTAFTWFSWAPTGRALHPCLHSFTRTVCTPAQRWRNAVWRKQRSAVQQLHNHKPKPTEDPPHTPISQAKSEQAQTEQKQANTHTLTSHQCPLSLSDRETE